MTEPQDQNTSFSTKTSILADLWMNYRQDPEFEDFVSYNDLGLPLGYAISVGAAKPTQIGENFINETFELLLAGLNIVDRGYETLDDLFIESEHSPEG